MSVFDLQAAANFTRQNVLVGLFANKVCAAETPITSITITTLTATAAAAATTTTTTTCLYPEAPEAY